MVDSSGDHGPDGTPCVHPGGQRSQDSSSEQLDPTIAVTICWRKYKNRFLGLKNSPPYPGPHV